MHPTRLGPYTITSRLGRGGMGTVFEAVDSATGDTVAVKMLSSHLADDPGLRRRFETEIETLKSLRHPGIVRLLAFGEEDDQPYFAMELVRGRSLDQLLRDGRRFTWRETVAIAAEIARALKVAHDHGVVHRDLKPANLLLLDATAGTAADGSGAAGATAAAATVKLADFGIAKLFGGEAHTALGNVVGTVEYMAPEQGAGRPVDQRADLYALGLVMYAMLTGGPPFKGKQLTEVISMQQRVVPPRVRTVVADVPPELDELIARLLAKDPAQRPANALALSRLLAAIDTLHPPGLAPATNALPAAAPFGAPTAPAANAPRPAGPRPPAPTAHDRSDRPTRHAAADAAGGPPRPEGELLAPTCDDVPAVSGDAATTERPAHAPLPNATAGDGSGEAATRDFTAQPPAPSPGTARADDRVPPAGRVTARSTSGRRPADGATGPGDHGPRSRFMTVDEYERIAAEQERRERARQAWWQWGAAIAILAAIPAGGWLLLRPPSADRLHERIMTVAREYDRTRATADSRDDDGVDLRDVRDDVLRFLDRHGDDPRADAVRGVKRELDVNALETRVKRLWNDDRSLSPVKQEYLEAVSRKGAAARLEALEAFLDAHGEPEPGADADERLLPALARRTVQRLGSGALREQSHDPARAEALLDEAATLDTEAAGTADAGHRAELRGRARRLRRSVVSIYGDDPHAREQVDKAKRQLAAATAVDSAAAAQDTPGDAAGPTAGPSAAASTARDPASVPAPAFDPAPGFDPAPAAGQAPRPTPPSESPPDDAD